jgi:hypothetical protein
VDAEDKGKMVRGDNLEKGDPQGPGNTGVKGADGKGTQLVPKQVYPYDFSGKIPIPYGHKRPSHSGTYQVSPITHAKDHEKQGYPVKTLFSDKFKAADTGTRDIDSGDTVGHGFPVNEDKFENKLGGQSGYTKIKALNPERRYPDDHTRECRHQTGTGDGEPEGETKTCDQDGRGIGTHAHKSRVTERYLTGKPCQEIQANSRNDGKTDHIGHIKHIGIGYKGKNQEKDKKQAQPEFDKKGLKDLFVFYICLFKISASHGLKPAPLSLVIRCEFKV